MAYTINRTNGTLFATVVDGTINTDSSLIMIGKNFAGYGEALNENFFRLLENHANPTAPLTPQPGQLWFDSSLGLLKIWGTEWKDIGSQTAGSAGHDTPITGDIWYDTVNSQLNVYDGTQYVLIGPSFSSGTGTTGYLVDTVSDGVLEHVIIRVVVSDDVVAIISKDATFTPAPAIAGFTSIQPGYNLAAFVDGGVPLYVGTATNAELLNGIVDTQLVRNDTPNETMSGSLAILNNTGLTAGALGEAKISVSGSDVTFANQSINSDIILSINNAGAPTDVLTVDGTTARARVLSAPLAGTDIANMDYVDSEILIVLASISAGTQPIDSYAVAAIDTTILDFDSATIVTTTLSANASLTTANPVAGKRIERYFIASGAARTVTLNAAWRSFGEGSPIIIPDGKTLVVSLTATTSNESGIHCAAVLEN